MHYVGAGLCMGSALVLSYMIYKESPHEKKEKIDIKGSIEWVIFRFIYFLITCYLNWKRKRLMIAYYNLSKKPKEG